MSKRNEKETKKCERQSVFHEILFCRYFQVASQIRVTPFTGESTDSEADLADTESPASSPSAFKSYIQNENRKTATLASEPAYDVPYDCLNNVKKRESWFTLKRTPAKANTMSKSPKVLKRCAPYTAENMRTVCWLQHGFLNAFDRR